MGFKDSDFRLKVNVLPLIEIPKIQVNFDYQDSSSPSFDDIFTMVDDLVEEGEIGGKVEEHSPPRLRENCLRKIDFQNRL